MNRDKVAEASILGQPAKDKYQAEFYMHKVKCTDTPETREAMQKADAKAARKSELTGKHVDPDYTPDNLVRLGAKERTIEVPYVLIKRVNAKDSKSSPVSDKHKQQWPELWAAFKAENNEYFRERRQPVRVEEGGQQHNTQSTDWSGGVNYTPTDYTISFG